jgi:amyloid beta precursor protein binding protein 1
LWGAKGQRALGETTVVLLRASAAGTETLKNLVLPGIGRIVVVDDDAPTTSAASNFFTPASKQEQPRAQIALETLQELNPDVHGEWKKVNSITEWTSVLDGGGAGKTLVVAADLELPLLRGVAKECTDRKIPLIIVQSYGLIGSVRIQSPPLPILEPKPENEPPVLSLVQPFDSFVQLAQSIDWDKLDNAQHGHVPYPLILWNVAREWKASHGGALPSSFQEKEEFRQSIRAKSRNWDNELNFQEALQNAYLAYTDREVDLDFVASLKEQCDGGVAPKMYALLCALQAFIKKNNRAPLHGTIPDMTSSTNLYVQLQKLYHDQAVQDVQEFATFLGSDSGIAQDEAQSFCRNVYSLDLLTTRTLEQEYSVIDDAEVLDEWNMILMDPYEVPEQTPFLWYIALKAANVFCDKYNRYPGTIETYLQDVEPLQECIVKVVADMKLEKSELVKETLLGAEGKYAMEMAREANAEVHNIASVLGGVASQEAVKIITGQYVPLNNTYIYNGIASTGGVYNV